MKEESVENSLSYPHVLLSSCLDTFTFQFLKKQKKKMLQTDLTYLKFDFMPVSIHSHRVEHEMS